MASDTIKKSVRSAKEVGRARSEIVVDDLSAAVATAVNDAGEGFGTVSGVAGGLYAKVADRAGEAMDALPAGLSDVGAASEHLVRRGRQRLDHGIREQPLEALLLAGAIGYLVGWASSR